MDSADLEIRQMFIEEANQIIDDAEDAFIRLDRGDQSSELIEKIFRLAHNFKGSAKAVGLDDLARLSHIMEDVITLVKTGARPADSELCSVLLKGLDGLKESLKILGRDPAAPTDTRVTQNLIEAFLVGGSQVGSAPAVTSPNATPVANGASEKPVRSAPQNSNPVTPAEKERESIRVSIQKLDTLLNLVGEMVVHQSIITGHRIQGTTGSDHAVQTLSYVEKIVYEIQNLSLILRMVPIKPLFQKMSRVVRDCSVSLGKEVVFEVEGEHVELDKIVMERITDPLTHLIRNAVDHGLESTPDRMLSGKSEAGQIRLSAHQREDQILITVKDDGKGLDAEKLRKKAIEKGIISPEDHLTEQECYALIFRSGFSTKEQVTDISGRGVGMDSVQKAVEELKGRIGIETTLGKGTTFSVSLPLSLSIIPGMVVSIEEKKYVVPVSHLVEIIEYGKLNMKESGPGGHMIDLRGEVIPVIDLARMLHGRQRGASTENSKKPGLVVMSAGKKLSFQVDAILGQQQIVIKKLGDEILGIPGIIGGTVLSNGEPSLILELDQIYRSHRNAA